MTFAVHTESVLPLTPEFSQENIPENNDKILEIFLKHAQVLSPQKRTSYPDDGGELPEEPWSSTWYQRNKKRLAYIPTAFSGLGIGYYLSAACQVSKPLTWVSFFLRVAGGVMTLPHFIPSILGLCMEDAVVSGPEKSQIPVT